MTQPTPTEITVTDLRPAVDRNRTTLIAVVVGVLAILGSIWLPKALAANQHAGAAPVHHTQTLRFVAEGTMATPVAAYVDATGQHTTAPVNVDITVTDLRSASLAVLVQNGGCSILLDGITEAAAGSDVGSDPAVLDLCTYTG